MSESAEIPTVASATVRMEARRCLTKGRITMIECDCGQRWRWSETYAGDGWVKA